MKSSTAGLLAGLAFFIVKLVLYFLNVQHQVLVKAPFIPLVAFTFIAVFYSILRYRQQTAMYHWIDAFKEGGRASLVAAVIGALSVFIYYRFIDVEYLELMKVTEYNEAKAILSGDQLKNQYDFIKFRNSLNTRVTLLLSGITVLGFLASLAIAMLAKTLPARAVKK